MIVWLSLNQPIPPAITQQKTEIEKKKNTTPYDVTTENSKNVHKENQISINKIKNKEDRIPSGNGLISATNIHYQKRNSNKKVYPGNKAPLPFQKPEISLITHKEENSKEEAYTEKKELVSNQIQEKNTPTINDSANKEKPPAVTTTNITEPSPDSLIKKVKQEKGWQWGILARIGTSGVGKGLVNVGGPAAADLSNL
ncbi:MAG: hypothetical protein ICV53_16765, partial [Flavisolibacter sp.]|nr:hypothetical protein [Flavisolibacter sp.]